MRLGAFALVVAALVTSGLARADEPTSKAACVGAYEDAQKKRLAGDLPGAKLELQVCGQDACPALIRTECVGWLREVEAAMPSVIVAVRNAAGSDVTSAKISVDGQPLRPRAPGEAVEVKPGLRKFRVEVAGEPPLERDVLIQSGEKSRVISLVVGAPSPQLARDAPAPRAGLPTPMIVLGVIGLASVAAGITFDAAGTVRLHDLHTGCAPNCSPGRVDGTRTEIIAGDSLLAAGVVALGAATIYFFTHREARPRDALRSPLAGSF